RRAPARRRPPFPLQVAGNSTPFDRSIHPLAPARGFGAHHRAALPLALTPRDDAGRGNSPPLGSLPVIVSRLPLVAPVTARSEVGGLILAAVLQGDDVVELPAVAGAQLALAAVALAASVKEDLRPLMVCEALAGFVTE